MPVALTRLKATGAVVMHTTCEVCGAPACLGEGVDMWTALAGAQEERAGRSPDKPAGWWRRHLGRWFCGDHWRG